MEQNASFNLDRSIESWSNKIKDETSITESDAEELKSHLLDQIDDLKKAGLSDKEAFLVASNRLSLNEELAEDFHHSNNHLIQMKKSLLILGGVLVFFFLYYFIEAFSELLFIGIYQFSDSNEYIAYNWFKRSLISWHFIIFFLLTSIFLFDKLTIRVIEKVKIKPKYTLYFLAITIIFELIGIEADPTIKNCLSDNYFLLGKYFHAIKYYNISFPLLVCIGFILIYLKYYRKTRIENVKR